MKCFYHDDNDGKCAAAIVAKALSLLKDKPDLALKCIPVNYEKPFPFKEIEKNEMVYIVDFSLQRKGDWEKLLDITDGVVWIDHHITAIEAAEKNSYVKKLDGIRDMSVAGCMLTWNFFYGFQEAPMAVKLIADYATWKFEYGDRAKRLNAGLRLYNTSPDSTLWGSLFSGNLVVLDDILYDGLIALNYQKSLYASIVKGSAYYRLFEGRMAVVCNTSIRTSMLFDGIPRIKFDVMIAYSYNGDKWSCSIYTEKDIDVSEIARKHGGGGHKKAADFVSKKIPDFVKNVAMGVMA